MRTLAHLVIGAVLSMVLLLAALILVLALSINHLAPGTTLPIPTVTTSLSPTGCRLPPCAVTDAYRVPVVPPITVPAPAPVQAPVTTTTVPAPVQAPAAPPAPPVVAPPVVIHEAACLVTVTVPGGYAGDVVQFAEPCDTALTYVPAIGSTFTVTPYTAVGTTDQPSIDDGQS